MVRTGTQESQEHGTCISLADGNKLYSPLNHHISVVNAEHGAQKVNIPLQLGDAGRAKKRGERLTEQIQEPGAKDTAFLTM